MKRVQGIKAALQRAQRWQRPPNWTKREWQAELFALAWAAACQCLFEQPDADDNTLTRYILAALKRFWREEWAYAARCVPLVEPSLPTDEGEPCDVLECVATDWDENRIILRLALQEALARLSEKDRFLVHCLFWEGKSQAEVAQGLGISRRAVRKRLNAVLKKLRAMLE